MKRILIVVLAVLMLVTFTGCSPANFMSDSQRDKLVSKYDDPAMEMVLEYEHNDNTYKLTLQYDLLLDATPITVVNFINLVEDKYYDAVIDGNKTTSLLVDSRINGSVTNAWVAGRYTKTTVEDETTTHTYGYAKELDYTIKGEFVSNDYVLPVVEKDAEEDKVTDNNAKFQLMSLAMYHKNVAEDFDEASSAFFFTTSSYATENYKNYAVFAHVTNVKVEVNGELSYEGNAVDASIIDDINNNMTATDTYDVVDGEDKESVKMLDNTFRIVSIKMIGDADYSQLPTNYIIKK